MLKKVLASLLAFTLIFSPTVGSIVFQDDGMVEAKRKSSGKQNFQPNKNKQQTNVQKNKTQQQKKQEQQKNKQNQQQQQKKTGGVMGALLFGGLAGLLFGSLLGGMGALAPILGAIINIVAIIIVIGLIRKLLVWLFTDKNKKKKEDDERWNHS